MILRFFTKPSKYCHRRNHVAGAGRPPSLPVVAIAGGNSLRLLLLIDYERCKLPFNLCGNELRTFSIARFCMHSNIA